MQWADPIQQTQLFKEQDEGEKCIGGPSCGAFDDTKKTRRGLRRRTTEEQKQARSERRKEKRRLKRRQALPVDLRVTTWNLQGLSTHERNRKRLRRVAEFTHRKGWQITLVTELRSTTVGVVWLGEGEKQTALIHSERSGIILWGNALNQWIQGGQKKNFGDRVTSITLEKITPKSLTLVIGGDHNAHIGREERGPPNGKYGLTTPSTIAGEDLIDWCKANEMQWVNSFFNIKKRGTWFNKSHKRWYELDGFVMRKDERHKLCKSMKVTDDNALSDHQPITLTIRTTSKNNRLARTQRKPNLNWEALNVPQKALEFLERTEVLSTTLSEDCSWKDIAEIMEKAVREICGIKKRHVANPWTIGHEEELESLHEKIAKAVRCRNEDTEAGRDSKWAKDQLKVARRNMKTA